MTLGRLPERPPEHTDCQPGRCSRSFRYDLWHSTCSAVLDGMAGSQKMRRSRRDDSTENNMAEGDTEWKQEIKRQGTLRALLGSKAENVRR